MLCPNCESNNLSYSVYKTCNTGIVDGRLKMHDITVLFVLGCDECSETIRCIDADSNEGVALLNRRL